MSQPRASIIIPTHNRCELVRNTLSSIFSQKIPVEVLVIDDGSTDGVPGLRNEFPHIRYISLTRWRSESGWCSPTRPLNIGIQKAKSEKLIINVGDVMHTSTDYIKTMLGQLTKKNFVIGTVWGAPSKGSMKHEILYTGEGRQKPFFFSGAIHKQHLLDIGGYDEDYTLPGYDDDDMGDRITQGLKLEGVYSPNCIALHQWHEPSPFYNQGATSHDLYFRKTCDWADGKISHIRNIGRQWGQL